MLTDKQRLFLDEVHYGVVATLAADGSIQQTVVWYLVEGDEVRFSIGANSVKAKNLRRNPTITLTIEDGPRYLSVSGTGVVEPLDETLLQRIVVRYIGPERAAEWLARRPDAARASVRMQIARVYGQGVK